MGEKMTENKDKYKENNKIGELPSILNDVNVGDLVELIVENGERMSGFTSSLGVNVGKGLGLCIGLSVFHPSELSAPNCAAELQREIENTYFVFPLNRVEKYRILQ